MPSAASVINRILNQVSDSPFQYQMNNSSTRIANAGINHKGAAFSAKVKPEPMIFLPLQFTSNQGRKKQTRMIMAPVGDSQAARLFRLELVFSWSIAIFRFGYLKV
jgi:hypothetical protein